VVDKKRVIGKRRAKEEERHKGSLTQIKTRKKQKKHKKGLLGSML
jgi:hypothetical protein